MLNHLYLTFPSLRPLALRSVALRPLARGSLGVGPEGDAVAAWVRAMAASPGEMSMVSIAIQLYGRAGVVGSVPPRAFRPPPKVTSAIVRIDVYPTPALDVSSIERFFTLARAGFSAPRKQVHNSLQHALSLPAPDVERMLSQAGIDGKRRAQTLALEEWGRLYLAWETAMADSPSA